MCPQSRNCMATAWCDTFGFGAAQHFQSSFEITENQCTSQSLAINYHFNKKYFKKRHRLIYSCRHLLTPANIPTQMLEKGQTFSLPCRLKYHFCTGKTYILSLCWKLIMLLNLLYMFGCVDMYINIKKSNLYNRIWLKALMLFCSSYVMTQEKWRN